MANFHSFDLDNLSSLADPLAEPQPQPEVEAELDRALGAEDVIVADGDIDVDTLATDDTALAVLDEPQGEPERLTAPDEIPISHALRWEPVFHRRA